MKTYRIVLGGWLVAMGSLPGIAQSSFQRFDEVWQYAQQHAPDLRIKALEQQKAEVTRKAADGQRLPQVGLSSMAQNNLNLPITPVPGEILGQPGTTIPLQFGKKYNYNAVLNAQVDLLNLTNRFNRQQARLSQELVRHQGNVVWQTLRENLASAYYQQLLAQQAVRVAAENRTASDTLDRLAEQKLTEGLISAVERNQSKVIRQTAWDSWRDSQQRLEEARWALGQLMGLPPDQPPQLTEPAESLLPDSAQTGLPLRSDPAIALAEAQAQLAQSRWDQQRWSAVPRVSLYGSLGYQQFQDSFRLSFGPGAWNPNSLIGLRLEVPLFTGFSQQNNRRAAQIDLEIARKQAETTRQQAQFAELKLKGQVRFGAEAVAGAATTVALYQSTLTLTRQRFEQGLVGLEAYQTAFRDYLNAQMNYLNRLADYQAAQAVFASRLPE
ncbi:TolC family protein [Larkinella sp. VNQ87]|uniref:TolC family protein n=1 Tax=Larkinella sp. VNQ87 TaxID=3400921 RepID=UPI003BFD99AE